MVRDRDARMEHQFERAAAPNVGDRCTQQRHRDMALAEHCARSVSVPRNERGDEARRTAKSILRPMTAAAASGKTTVHPSSDLIIPRNRPDWHGRRCLVTGASGFIGSALCDRLTRLGADVWGLGRRSAGPIESSHWLSCDVTDQKQVTYVMRACRPDVVFHLASIVAGARRLDLVLPMLHGNLTGFVNVAVAAAELQCNRIIGIGSLMEPDELQAMTPSSPYAAAKFAASCYARMLSSVFGLPIVVARVFMVYGPRQQDLTKLVPYVVSELLRGHKPKLSSGAQQFDWVYVDDVCEALVAIAANENVVGRMIDVGTGVLTSVIDVARGLASRLNAVDSLQIGVLPDRVGDPTRVADAHTTRALTGWQARVGLSEGLDETVQWFKENVPA